jgi:predicted phosphodiesterase
MTETIPQLHADGPVLVFGGPYGNLEATEALLAEAARRCIPPERIICTGDLAAYCAEPQAVIDRLREAGIAIVRGNCEESLAAGAGDCGCGFDDESACAALSEQWYAYCDRAVDRAVRPWLGALPPRIDLVIAGLRLAVVHGSVTSVNRFVFFSDMDAIRAELDVAGCDGVIAGHSGIPFTRAVGGRLWHNAGVVGLPANDGTPRAWFSVLTPAGQGTLAIEHCALDYGHGTAAAKMRARDLPEGYAAALETGLWPSNDVLPPAERAWIGRPLEAGAIEWRAGSSHDNGTGWPRDRFANRTVITPSHASCQNNAKIEA